MCFTMFCILSLCPYQPIRYEQMPVTRQASTAIHIGIEPPQVEGEWRNGAVADRTADFHEELGVCFSQLFHVPYDRGRLFAILQRLRKEPASNGDAVVLVSDKLTAGLPTHEDLNHVVSVPTKVDLDSGDVRGGRTLAVEAVFQQPLLDGEGITHEEASQSDRRGRRWQLPLRRESSEGRLRQCPQRWDASRASRREA